MSTHPRDLQFCWNLSPEHLKAIGEVAVLWAATEFTLSTIIWDLVELSTERGWAVTTHLSERIRVDICNSLASQILGDSEITVELKNHLKHLTENIYPKRNKLLHSRWGHSENVEGFSVLQTLRARGSLKVDYEFYSAADIMAVADEIYNANDKLCNIKDKMQSHLHSLKQL